MKKIISTLSIIFSVFMFSQQKKNDSVNKIVEKQIQEVEINMKKKLIERKVDRLVFNVENSITASGSDAVEVLKKTPGVAIQGNTIGIIGKSSVSVMIDEKMVQLSGEALMNYLRATSSENIKSIEVITTPPSKYDAEGNSGIINIQLKKAKQNSWSNSTRTTYTQTSYPALSLGNTFNYNKDRYSFSIMLDAKKGNENVTERSNIEYPSYLWMSKVKRKDSKDVQSVKVSADYQISKKSSIGAIFQFYNSTPDIQETNVVNLLSRQGQGNKILSTNAETDAKNWNNSLNLHFTHDLDSLGKKFSVDLDYFKFKEDKNRLFDTQENNVLQLSAQNLGQQDINNLSAKIDFIHPAKFANYTYGAKITSTKNDSSIKFIDQTTGTPVVDPLQTDAYQYRENIQAAYFDLAKSFGEKWQIKLGARAEYTQTTSKSVTNSTEYKNDYFKIFPTFYVLRVLNGSNTINLSYSKRINRPSFWELNPFKWYFNANSYAEGNPFLQPAISHNFELTHTYKEKLFTSFFTQLKSNGFSQVPYVKDDLTQVFTRLNYYKSYAYGISQNYVFNKWSWLESNAQYNIYYIKTKIDDQYKDAVPSQSGFGFAFSLNNSFVLNKSKTISGELNYNYNAPNKGLIYKQSGSMRLDLGLRFLFLNKNLQCSISIDDILKTSNPDNTTYTNGITQTYNVYADTRRLRLSLRYNFGNKNIKGKNREIGNSDEKSRLK